MSSETFSLLLQGLPVTIMLTLGAFGLGAALAVPLTALRVAPHWLPRTVAALLIQFVRAVPPLLWLFIIFFGVGMSIVPIDPFPAALVGLTLIATANIAEIYRGALSSISLGQFEAIRALSIRPTSAFFEIIAPQVFRVALPSGATYLIGLMKETAIASTIGVTELVFRGNQVTQLTFRGLEAFAVVAVLFILLSLPIAWASRWLDNALRSKVAR
ncbi:amino acid ABC transporter permease [Pseudogemmobacter sonorensis]|uniref:amino acid ABC transporter permease n=1 Tax=Pseudogemmobacter sonorensis TaxID=2989681 RepID=UPI0036CD5AC9